MHFLNIACVFVCECECVYSCQEIRRFEYQASCVACGEMKDVHLVKMLQTHTLKLVDF